MTLCQNIIESIHEQAIAQVMAVQRHRQSIDAIGRIATELRDAGLEAYATAYPYDNGAGVLAILTLQNCPGEALQETLETLIADGYIFASPHKGKPGQTRLRAAKDGIRLSLQASEVVSA